MSGITPKRAFPYPTASDKIALTPAKVQELATSLDNLLGVTQKLDPVLGAKFSGSVGLYRVSGLVVTTINVITTAGTVPGDNIFTIPVGYVPIVFHPSSVVNTSTEANVRVHPDPDKTCKVQATLATGITLRGTVVWVWSGA